MVSLEIINELIYKTSRSGGAGGQNVNKVETKVQLYFDIHASKTLTEEQKSIIIQKLSNRINQKGILSLSSDATRSQLTNKENVTTRFLQLIEKTILPDKERKKTIIPESVQLERLKAKKMKAERKADRKFRTDIS